MFRVPGITYLRHVLEAACRVDDASAGLVAVEDRDEAALRLVAAHGHDRNFMAQAKRSPLDSGTTCAQAARERRQVVVRDVDTDPTFAPHLDLARLGAFRSVQSTPMLDSQRRLVGVLTTQFADPHHPSRGSLNQLEALARVGALILEAHRLHKDVAQMDRRLGIASRPLSAAAGQAAAGARMLIPALAREGGQALVEPAQRHLLVVIDELTRHVQRRAEPIFDV